MLYLLSFTSRLRHLHTGLLLSQAGGEVHVHVRVGDRRPGVQQGAEQPGDGGHHFLQVSSELIRSSDIFHLSWVKLAGLFHKGTSSAGTENLGL